LTCGIPLGRLKLPGAIPLGDLPTGRIVELPGRGTTYVVDSGPLNSGPTFVLLHSLGCTGLLTWYPALKALTELGRVVVFDQRWHGAGITSPRFLLEECADDVAVLADQLNIESFIPVGYSMGSMVAQLVWRRHPQRTTGLVLCAAAATLGGIAAHQRLGIGIFAAVLETFGQPQPRGAIVQPSETAESDFYRWALGQVRSTKPSALARVVAELLRFDSRRWVSEIDVPTSVVIPLNDRCISPRDQRWLAAQIPGAQITAVNGGHSSCTLTPKVFVPALQSALDSVVSRTSAARGSSPSAS
jgi:pimeloyl-ACP methyl ester carboxylesterase